MASTVISFSGGGSASSGVDRGSVVKEVYLDVDADSGPNQNYSSSVPPELCAYVRLLYAEGRQSPSGRAQEGPLSDHLVCPEPQDFDPDGVVTGVGALLSAGFDEKWLAYEKSSTPSPYRVSKLVNVKAVQNSLRQIFAWTPGERIINPEFGSRLRRYLYEGITERNIEQIMAEIQHSVSIWEPRVQVDRVVNVQTVDDTENNTVRLDVYYHIKGLSDEQYVYSYVYDRTAD